MDAILDILNELKPGIDYRTRHDLVDTRELDSLTIITLGLFQLMVNGLMLQLASSLSLNLLGSGIVAANFVSAFVGAIIVSIMCTILGVKKH